MGFSLRRILFAVVRVFNLGKMDFEDEEIGVEYDVDNEYAGHILKQMCKNIDLREITFVAGIDRQRYVILMFIEREKYENRAFDFNAWCNGLTTTTEIDRNMLNVYSN